MPIQPESGQAYTIPEQLKSGQTYTLPVQLMSGQTYTLPLWLMNCQTYTLPGQLKRGQTSSYICARISVSVVNTWSTPTRLDEQCKGPRRLQKQRPAEETSSGSSTDFS